MLQGMREAGQDWDNRGWKLFVELEEQVQIEQVNAKIKDIAEPHVKGGDEELSLHPMEKWRLYSEFQHGEATHGRIDIVYRFGVIGLLVLCLACISFITLSPANIGSASFMLRVCSYVYFSLVVCFLI